MNLETDRPKEWLDTLGDLIRAKFNYENCNKALKKKFGDEEGAISGQEYQMAKNRIDGGPQVDEKIDDLGKRAKPQKKKKLAIWSKQKQQQADTSTLAQIINMGVYQGILPFCANQKLKEEDVQEVNPGGAIVANITYFFPETKLDHPLIMLGIRVVILYIKFKSVCNRIAAVKDRLVTIGKNPSGLKPEMRTEKHK